VGHAGWAGYCQWKVKSVSFVHSSVHAVGHAGWAGYCQWKVKSVSFVHSSVHAVIVSCLFSHGS
jgi:hypothetical protein